MRRTHRTLLAAIALVGLVTACGDDDDAADTTSTAAAATTVEEAPTTDAPDATEAPVATDADTTTPDTAAPGVSGDITVFAAASLTAAFTDIGDAFMEENPDATVTFNFAASSELVTQITEGGAPADVFASADINNMTKLTDADANGSSPVLFATNLLEIIVAPDNPLDIGGVEDLANDDLITVVCAPEVPCGAYAQQIFDAAGVTVNPDSFEENVKAVVTKVTAGEADAGIVYKTDVTAAGDDASGVEIPEDINVIAQYPIATTAEAPNAEGGEAFIDFVLSEAGQEILSAYGFLPPPTVEGDVTVFAAASLTAAFTEIGDAFMVEYPDATVTFNFAASSELVTQITEGGAPADVFASADINNMTKLTDAGANGSDPVEFATNLLEIIVAPDNPLGIAGVEDLENDDLITVVCAPEVPCGAYAQQIFDAAGVTVNPDSFEENVKAVVTKVTAGEADAGIVYKTDVTAAGDDASGVEIPAEINVIAQYPIAPTAEAPNASAARAFIAFVLSEQGQKILASYGFLPPSG